MIVGKAERTMGLLPVKLPVSSKQQEHVHKICKAAATTWQGQRHRLSQCFAISEDSCDGRRCHIPDGRVARSCRPQDTTCVDRISVRTDAATVFPNNIGAWRQARERIRTIIAVTVLGSSASRMSLRLRSTYMVTPGRAYSLASQLPSASVSSKTTP